MKNMPDTFSIDYACLQISPFETVIYNVSRPFLQIKSANRHKRNIFLIESLSMLAWPQTKTVKRPDKKPGISDRSSFLRRRSVKFQFVWRKLCYNIPPVGCFKSMLAHVIHPQNTKNHSFVSARCTFWYKGVRLTETKTCQRLVNVGNLNETPCWRKLTSIV